MSWTKRRISRRARIRVEAAYEDAQRQVFLQSRDISEEGIYLFAPDPPEVGSRCQAAFPTGRGRKRELYAEPIVHVEAYGEQDCRRDAGAPSGTSFSTIGATLTDETWL